MALDTVEEYVAAARVLLQDQVAPYRTPDTELVLALNQAVLEARRLRPDLFLDRFDDLPDFAAADSTAVDIDHQYRMAFLYFIVGQAHLKDEEETQDARAVAFIAKFTGILSGSGA